MKKRSSVLSSLSAAAVNVATTSRMPSRQSQIQTGSICALPMANTDALDPRLHSHATLSPDAAVPC